jgi:hypothetical protein
MQLPVIFLSDLLFGRAKLGAAATVGAAAMGGQGRDDTTPHQSQIRLRTLVHPHPPRNSRAGRAAMKVKAESDPIPNQRGKAAHGHVFVEMLKIEKEKKERRRGP